MAVTARWPTQMWAAGTRWPCGGEREEKNLEGAEADEQQDGDDAEAAAQQAAGLVAHVGRAALDERDSGFGGADRRVAERQGDCPQSVTGCFDGIGDGEGGIGGGHESVLGRRPAAGGGQRCGVRGWSAW